MKLDQTIVPVTLLEVKIMSTDDAIAKALDTLTKLLESEDEGMRLSAASRIIEYDTFQKSRP